MAIVTSAAVELRQRLGGRATVIDAPDELLVYAYDASFEAMMRPRVPDAVVQPRDVTAVAETLAFANARRIPVTPRGAATGQAGGALAERGGIVLDLSAMNRVIEVDAENLQVIAQPGVVHAELNDLLATYGLIFPPDPGRSRMCTIG